MSKIPDLRLLAIMPLVLLQSAAADNLLVVPSGSTTVISGSIYSSSTSSQAAISGSSGSVLVADHITASTTGNFANALLFKAGAQATVSDSVLSTQATTAPVVVSSGSGTRVTLNNSNISSNGSQSHGVRADNGGTAVINGGSIAVNDISACAISVDGAGSVVSGSGVTLLVKNKGNVGANVALGGVLDLADSSIQSTSTMAYAGVSMSGGSATLTNVNVNMAESGMAFRMTSGASAIINGGTYTAANDHGMLIMLGTASISNATINAGGSFHYGINVNTTSTVSLTNVSIKTTGNSGYGIWGVSTGTALTGSNVEITTSGNSAHGMTLQGQTAKIDGITVNTTGAGSYALYADSGLTISNINLNTQGAVSVGVADFGGLVSIDSGSVTTTGSSGYGYYVASSSTLVSNNVTINTSGYNARGVYAYGGEISLNGDSIITSGSNATGIHALGSRGSVSGTNISITTSGDYANAVFTDTSARVILSGSTTIAASGFGANGLVASGSSLVRNDGSLSITLNGVSLNASAVSAQGASQINLGEGTVINANKNNGIIAIGSSTITGSNISVSTSAGSGRNGIFADSLSNIVLDSGTVRSTGASIWTILVGGTATMTLSDLDVLATGDQAIGLIADVGGMATVNHSTIVTTGSGAYAVQAFSTAGPTYVIADNSVFGTEGQGSHAVYSLSPNSYVILNGGTVSTSGSGAFGIVSQLGAVASATNTKIETTGFGGHGAYAVSRGSVVLTGGTIDTQGDNGYGLYANGANSNITGVDTVIRTSGSSAIGVVAAGRGIVRLASAEIITVGENARGLVMSGSGSDIQTDNNTEVITHGFAAHGIQVQNGATKIYDGSIGNILPMIQVNGESAALLNATGANSQITLKNTVLNVGMTAGINTWGVKTDAEGTIALDHGFISGGVGLWSADGGTIVVASNAVANGSRTRVDAGGVFDITQASDGITVGSLEGEGLVALGGNTLTIGGSITTADSASTLFSGTINGTGSLIKQGVGVLTLSGTSAFAYEGATVIDQGVLALRSIGSSSEFSKTITLNGGWLDLSDSPDFAYTPADGNNPNAWGNLVVLAGTGAEGAGAAGGVIGANDKLTYTVDAGTAVAIDYGIGNATQNNESGIDKRGIYLAKTGEGTLTLTGSNAYIGNTRVENGTLQITQDFNLGDAAIAREVVLGNQFDIASSGTLQISGNFQTTRMIELRQNGAVIVDEDMDSRWGGVSYDLNGTAHTLTKEGNGSLAFSGAVKLSGLVMNAGIIDLGSSAVISATAINAPAITMNSGTAIVNGGTVRNVSGDLIVARSGGVSALVLANVDAQAANTNLVHVSDGSTLMFTASNARLDGDIVADSTSHGKIYLRGSSVLTGRMHAVDADIESSSIWNLTANSVIGVLKNDGRINYAAPDATSGFKTLTVDSLSGTGGVISLNTQLGDDASPTDCLIVTGNASGSTKLTINNAGGSGAPTEGKGIQIVSVGGQNTNGATTFALSNLVAAGAYRYDLILDPDNNWYLRNAGRNPVVDPNLDTAAIAGLGWFTEMDNLHRRMGDLRLSEKNGSSLVDNTWIRFSGQRLTAQLPLEGASSFSQNDYGVDVGIDHGWSKKDTPASNNVYYTGLFVGANTSDRKFGDGYTGGTNNVHAGLYATWINRDGWYADLVGKFSHDRRHIDGAQNTIKYNAQSEGLSLEVGRQFKQANSWWFEPSIQMTSIWSNAVDYDSVERQSGAPNHVHINSARANEYRGLVRFGREWQDSRWYPYAKFGTTFRETQGGDLTFAGKTFQANLDGWNMVAGFGTQYLVNRNTQIYFDYEYDKSSHYERPWVINVGYRKLW